MPTIAGSGQSCDSNTAIAVRSAVLQAREGLKGRAPLFGLLFASIEHPLDQALSACHGACECRIIGATTAGEFTERGLTHGGLALLLVASDELIIDGGMTIGLTTDLAGAAQRLCQGYGDAGRRAAATGMSQGTSLLLLDGRSGTGERLVRELQHKTRPFQQIVGGAAGDGGSFTEMRAGQNSTAASDTAAVIHLFGRRRAGIGVGHGLRASSERMLVTRAEGAVVQHINERPAIEVYRDFARARGVTLSAESVGGFLIKHELGVYFLDELRTARAPLSVRADGALVCAADVPQGSSVCILDGDPEGMLQGTDEALRAASGALEAQEPAAVLVFDCVARGAILQEHFERVIGQIRQTFPTSPIAGFLTYGEIARHRGSTAAWHNSTIVVAALPA